MGIVRQNAKIFLENPHHQNLQIKQNKTKKMIIKMHHLMKQISVKNLVHSLSWSVTPQSERQEGGKEKDEQETSNYSNYYDFCLSSKLLGCDVIGLCFLLYLVVSQIDGFA